MTQQQVECAVLLNGAAFRLRPSLRLKSAGRKYRMERTQIYLIFASSCWIERSSVLAAMVMVLAMVDMNVVKLAEMIAPLPCLSVGSRLSDRRTEERASEGALPLYRCAR